MPKLKCFNCGFEYQGTESESPRAQVAELQAENERLKTVPMKYRRMEFNAQLQKENDELKRQRDEYKADAERLEERLLLMFEMPVINDTYIQVRNDQDFAIDDIEYDMFSAGWKSAVALVIRTTKGATE